MGNVFYKADLLPMAFFKERARCWETIEAVMDAKRVERLKQIIAESMGDTEQDGGFDEETSHTLHFLNYRTGNLIFPFKRTELAHASYILSADDLGDLYRVPEKSPNLSADNTM